MDILTIEKSRNELLGFLEYGSSSRLKLKRISDFYSLLLKENENYLIESYLLEFIPQYIQYTKIYSPFGVKTEFTQSILAINEKLINSDELYAFRDQLITLNFNVKDKLTELEDILNGQETLSARDRKILFPVIEEVESTDSNLLLGAVDSLTIKISKAKFKDRFIIVPSAAELDKKLEEQIKISWQKAKDFCNGYVKKINDYHEVIINFDEHLGVYKGDSVGTALSIGFIEQILKFYNTHTVLKPFGDVVFTGGINANGEINQISKDITEKKTEIVFHSPCRILVVPKIDENYAFSKLEELKKEFSKRDLNIVSAKSIDEILLRRDLVEISNQQLIVRTGKFVKRNWVSALVTVVLSVLFAFLFVMDFDDNPAVIENKGTTLLIKNKNGKILWTAKLWIKLDDNFHYRLSNLAKCIDINVDGTNEILLCHDDFGDGINEMGIISCYNYKGDLIWKYTFKDTVGTINEVHSTAYSIGIVQNNRMANDSVIYCYISNHPLFPSAIFRLSARTGNRLDKGLWNAGHIVNAMIGDFNKDDKLEIVALGVHNGFNAAILFSADPDSLNGQTPSISNYFFADLPIVQPTSLVSFLPCDLTKYHNIRMNSAVGSTLMFDSGSEEFRFLIHEGIDTDCRSVHYRFDRNLKFLSVSPGNGFEAERDLLVSHGKLNPPRTNTPEYAKILEDNIRYWKDGKWVKREELE